LGLLSGHFNYKAVSPVIVAVLLIMVVVASVLLGYVFLTGLSSGLSSTASTGLQSTIVPRTYSPDAGIDYFGRKANFTVVLSNTVSKSQVGSVDLLAGSLLLQNISFALAPSETQTIVITQPLNSTGTWTLKVTTSGVKVNSYSFNVMHTKDEADFAISQWQSERFYRNLTLLGFMIAIVAFILAIASLVRPPKTIKLE
jgi:hypothetical protein